MSNKLNLDTGMISASHQAAEDIANGVNQYIDIRTSVTIERSIARLLDVDGINEQSIPYPNILVDHIAQRGGLPQGLAYWLGNAIIETGQSPQVISERVERGELDLLSLPRSDEERGRQVMYQHCREVLNKILDIRKVRDLQRKVNNPSMPLIYVIAATGNVYEDVTHALAVAEHGGDIVAVIRSTAQSLLDFVPFGPTTEGYGGTFATQENFRIMRSALDEWTQEHGHYLRLSSFCSGLCMPEIAAMGALEGLDNMVNDAMYGALYRGINLGRTMVDQKMSRMLNGFAGVTINTGEDNYNRTADALDAAPTVIASHLINYHLALDSGLLENQIGLGHSFEVNPDVPNSLLYEWAQAQLERELFPNCPLKYMPPTKHMTGDVYRTHACDTLFNLVSIATRQGIHLVGVPTEGIHTPHLSDRVIGLDNTHYVFNAAHDINEEIEFKPGGLIQSRAQHVLGEAHDMLAHIQKIGLFTAIGEGLFGDTPRSMEDGRGKEGVVIKVSEYYNPFNELILGNKS
jgi:beta-lysine 5,6-aminomutase alpha subunit